MKYSSGKITILQFVCFIYERSKKAELGSPYTIVVPV